LHRRKVKEWEAVEVGMRVILARLVGMSVKEESEKLMTLGRPESLSTLQLSTFKTAVKVQLLTVSEIPSSEASMKLVLRVWIRESEIERLPLRVTRGAAKEVNSQLWKEREETTRKAV
jgi:hypothetical protein